MISELHEATNTILRMGTKLFGGVYSHGKLDYDMEYDELSTLIGTVLDNTQYNFSVNIEPVEGQLRNYPFGKRYYKINVQEFKPMQDAVIVPAELLLDFLLNATIQIQDNSPQLKLVYTHSNQ